MPTLAWPQSSSSIAPTPSKVRDGSTYSADVSVPYTAGTTYQFSMVVDVATDTYSVYVTPQGGSQIALATDYSFRTEQATATSLSDLTEYTDAGAVSVSNFAISAGPSISSLAESPSSGDLDAGKTVTLTLNMSEAVTVAGGTPTLTLNDGGTATYISGSGTSALTFSYTVLRGQNTPDLTVTAVNLNGGDHHRRRRQCRQPVAHRPDPAAPQIDTTAPTVSSVAESTLERRPDAGKTVTLTLNMSEAVTVAGGTPTLTLNDGGTATYTSGSGTSALTFSYTVAPGRTPPRLTVTAVNLNRHHHRRRRQCRQPSLAGLTQTGPQIDTTTPTIIVGGGIAVERRPQCRQDRHADAQHERGGDGCRRHADADAQRRRHRDL